LQGHAAQSVDVVGVLKHLKGYSDYSFILITQRRVLHCCCGCWKPETIKLIGTHWFLIIIGF